MDGRGVGGAAVIEESTWAFTVMFPQLVFPHAATFITKYLIEFLLTSSLTLTLSLLALSDRLHR